jgi:hypothetical protein
LGFAEPVPLKRIGEEKLGRYGNDYEQNEGLGDDESVEVGEWS